MGLPPIINWIQSSYKKVGNSIMVFQTEIEFHNDAELALILQHCVFNAKYSRLPLNIWYGGVIKESDRQEIQNFMIKDDNAFGQAVRYEEPDSSRWNWTPNWVWMSDTLMSVCRKSDFTDFFAEKDVRFWILTQNYMYGKKDSKHINRSGVAHMVMIETNHLANWEPIKKENVDIGEVSDFDIPKWLFEWGD